MLSRAVLLALIGSALAVGPVHGQMSRGGMGGARSGGQPGRIGASAGQVSRAGPPAGQSQIRIQQFTRPNTRHLPTGVLASSSFIHLSPFGIARTHPHHFHHHRHFFPHHHRHFHRRHGIVIIDVPGFSGTTVVTQGFPGSRWAEHPMAASPFTDARVRSGGQLAPFDPMPQELVERLLVLAQINKNDVVYDLGSGDGRVVITAAAKYGAKAIGFEIDAGLAKLARENVRQAGVEELVQIRQQDFLTVDVSPATVVTLYLSRDGNDAVKSHLLKQLRPGARVVSYTFDMGDWTPKIMETYRDAVGDTHLLYYWEISEPSGLS
jgi:precorrin-6B methylase 2